MSTLCFDHVAILIDSLDTAVVEFERLGFTVTAGGKAGPLHNALVVLSDETYIELTALRSAWGRKVARAAERVGMLRRLAARQQGIMSRMLPWLGAPQGFVDWSMRVGDIDAICAVADAEGRESWPSHPFFRRRPDGHLVRWRLGGPRALPLPFLISDESDSCQRIPIGKARVHPNGATGCGRLTLAVRDPVAAAEHLERWQGTPPSRIAGTTISHERTTGPEGIRRLEIAAPGPLRRLPTALNLGIDLWIGSAG